MKNTNSHVKCESTSFTNPFENTKFSCCTEGCKNNGNEKLMPFQSSK